MHRVVFLVFAGVGCYEAVAPEEVPCGADGACPSGQVCDVDGLCRSDPLDSPEAYPFSPSNGVGVDLVNGVTAPIEGNGLVYLDTDTGKIERDGVTIRPAGTGTLAGIRFEPTASLGVFAATALTIAEASVVRVRGSRGLVVLVGGDIAIAGRLDLAAGACPDGDVAQRCAGPGGGGGGVQGEAARGCSPGITGNDLGDTGGGGGGFGQSGAIGGNEVEDPGNPPFHGSLGGDAGTGTGCPGAALEPLVGGSGGAAGGGLAGGDGGGGGGAVQLTALGAIRVTGVIDAGGGGGSGGLDLDEVDETGGGGGGGSGGAILIEAPAIELTGAILAANGGGGGAGGTEAEGTTGQASLAPARGGADGSAGGDGGTVTSAPTPGGRSYKDTGGGGGGAGRIRINVLHLAQAAAVITPEASIAPM